MSRFQPKKMFCIVLFSVLSCVKILEVEGQEMAWIGGSNVADRLSELDAPGGRSGTGEWPNDNGTVWMFGGKGVAYSSPTPMLLNDVWSFSLPDRTWQQVHPGTVSNLTVANYRTAQIPQPRQLMSVCGTGKILIIFGGLAENNQALGDLWVFDGEKKTWRMLVPVESYVADLLTPSTENSTKHVARDGGPSPRGDSAFWCTKSHLYVFGGQNESHILSDMWRLHLHDLTWEELKSSREAPALLRDRITADYPQGRNGAMTWLISVDDIDINSDNRIGSAALNSSEDIVEAESELTNKDSSNQTPSRETIVYRDILFMFGGNVLNKPVRNEDTSFSSDMWQYDVSSDTWHYITGSTQPGQPASYGRLGLPLASNVPGCRRGAATWTDSSSRLWMFGGAGADAEPPSRLRSAKLLSDLWRFHPDLKQWEWMGGANKGDSLVVFKEKGGELSRSAVPGGRVDATCFEDSDRRTFFLFGGLGHDGVQHDGYLNDLWIINVSGTLTGEIFMPAAYGFIVALVGVALLLCLVVVALYARDRSKSSEWRRSRPSARYNLLHDSDT